MIDQDEGERLRRQLRAMSAVNEQLRAQLEAAQAEARTAPRQALATDPLAEPARPVPVGLAPRRASAAAEWLAQLPKPAVGARAELVERPDGALFVLEGDTRRRLRSGLLAAAIEAMLGERRPMGDDELAGRVEGAPIEVLEGANGLPFIVLDGRRLGVRGLPLPFPVDQVAVERIAAGPDLDLAAASTPRRAHEADGWIAASTPPARSDPARLVLGPDGVAFVLEGAARRPVRSGLLLPALEARLGAAQAIGADELATFTEAPGVEVLEAPAGPPFVVLGGKRTVVAGLPAPFPVHQQSADSLPDGPPLDLVAPHRELLEDRARIASERDRVARKLDRVQAALDDLRRKEKAREAKPDPVRELRRLVKVRGGVAPAGVAIAKKVAKGAKRRVRRARSKG